MQPVDPLIIPARRRVYIPAVDFSIHAGCAGSSDTAACRPRLAAAHQISQPKAAGRASVVEKKYRCGEYSSMLWAVLWRGGSSGIEPVVGWQIDVDVGAI